MSRARVSSALLLLGVTVLVLVVGGAIGLGLNAAQGDESNGTGEPTAVAPTTELTEEALEAMTAEELEQGPETDPKVAEELPHRELNGEEALELTEGVFGAALEDPAGIYAELEPSKFLSEYAAVVPASALPEPSAEEPGGSEGAAPQALAPNQPVLVESTLPLRTENAEGEEEPVDLSLQSPEGSGGELQPRNPLAELAIPAHLGEGISLGEVTIGVEGAADEAAPTNVEDQYAFYPNVAENTDLVVTPTPTGVETMTDVRSAEAPMSSTYELSLPAGAELKTDEAGGAEVVEGTKTILIVAPPTATDAAGEPVQTELSISGDSLTVTIKPDPSTSFPALVDPIFLTPQWSWLFAHSSLAGWTGSTNSPTALQPVPYALWSNPQEAPGPDLSSGFGGAAGPGAEASWEYWVPRYAEDQTNFGSRPTSWLYQLRAEGLMYVLYGNGATYPALVTGLVDPATGWVGAITHSGGEGEIGLNSQFVSTNTASSPTVKGAEMQMVTWEYEPTAKRRDAYMAGATLFIVDESPPVVKSLTSPSGWMDTVAKPIPYEFEDTGLGVFDVTMVYEGSVLAGSGVNPGCLGTSASPCPRIVTSGTGGTGKVSLGNLSYEPAKLPTGLDTVSVMAADPLAAAEDNTHEASAPVVLKVDHTPPVVKLSGALTEEEKLGTARSEYPLTIVATDGTESAPQSGIAKVEVKVDGKKVTMADESAWNPNCQTQNCSFSGTWTLKSSEYSVGSHEVEVVATDAAGVVSTTPLSVDLGQSPPQTSFTTPHPTYEDHQVESIAFKATRGGTQLPGATFKCGLDTAGEVANTTCTSPFKLPEHLAPNTWHTFVVAATENGASDPTPAKWKFETGEYPAAPATEKLVLPEVGEKSASYYTLEAEWGAAPEGKAVEGVSGVTFEVELPGTTIKEGKEVPRTFEQVPAACVVDGQGHQVSWPIPVHDNPGHNAPVYLKVRGCRLFESAKYPEKEIQFRAAFDGGEKVAGASAPVTTEFHYDMNLVGVPTDPVEEVGPASLDLLTGAFTLTHTDVSIPVPGYEANLEFTRVYRSTPEGKLPTTSMVLGGGWQPSLPMEAEAQAEAWTRIEEINIPEQPAVYGKECWNGEGETVNCGAGCNPELCEEWLEEPRLPPEHWIELVDNEGTGVSFQEPQAGTYVPPEYAKELKLTKENGNFVLAYPNGAHTIFVTDSEGHWLPKIVSYQATPGSTRAVYESVGGKLRLVREIAPAPVECGDSNSIVTPGCRTLSFGYTANGLLEYIAYWGPTGVPAEAQLVAVYAYEEVAASGGGRRFQLASEADPRLPRLGTFYGYAAAPHGNLITSVSVPDEEPWVFGYDLHSGEAPAPGEAPSRLRSVARGGATTTIAYEVPVEGTGAPYDMSPESIARWGQSDLPVDATAVFPPNHFPAEFPPGEYTGATVHYMDPEGHQVNVASPSPPGVTGASIATSETDHKGNVVRELSPRNRLIALESPESASVSRQLDTHSVYNQAGTEMLESWGPLHEVRLESGESVQAREHTTTRYDEGEPTPPAGTPPAYLPTRETVAAVVPGKEGELEPKVTETRYDWKFRAPSEIVVDPGGLDIHSVTFYDAAGQVIGTRQPKGAITETIYYSATGSGECLGRPQYANLPCRVQPAAQVNGTGRPYLPVKKFPAYNYLDEPTEVVESPKGEGSEVRKTTTTYDPAGRQVETKTTGGGIALARTAARVKTNYNELTGLPTGQEFVCEGSKAECAGFDSQATKTEYNSLGQVTKYEDADGGVTETSYDAYGRPATVKDGKGTRTFHYDETSGALTSLEVSGVGTFTASYDADGDLISRGLPNGLTATTTFNQADEPTKLAYTKTSSCGASCTWFEETLERSAEGRIFADSSSLVSNRYKYDNAGRLTEATETPVGGECTSRAYTYDADSNRLSKTTRSPGVGGACASSGGTTQKYEYDEADRLLGPTYDGWGRITSLPAEFAGAKALTTEYFANNMIAKQTQAGVSNTFQLDATGRQRQREQTGGVAGVEIFHYDGPGDSPSWTALGSTWSQNVTGIGGELAAVQESSGTTTFKLTNLHGDVVASASSSPTATALLSTYRFDEFGEPGSGSAGRFGWLGGKSRRTELQSGVIQMGVRSYIPALGRFLSPDPIPGGSANAYDYANGNPVSGFDLSGESASQCEGGAFGQCQCKLWAHLTKGRRRGTMVVTVVRKCNRAGGITQTGYSQQWSQRTSPRASYHNVPSNEMPAVFPEVTEPCPATNRCQNYQKHEQLVYCTPGTEYQLNISWGFVYNVWGKAEEHQLNVQAHGKCA